MAVEHCETCRRPVCGSCLWYAESGERLCPDHAAERLKAGQTVTPPERYAEGIVYAEASAARGAGGAAPYRGNSLDVMALTSAAAGVTGLLACAGLSWLIPMLGFALGLVALFQARDAADPTRTRWLAGIGLAGGGVFVLTFLFVFLGMFMCMLMVFVAGLSGPRIGPTTGPLITATPAVP